LRALYAAPPEPMFAAAIGHPERAPPRDDERRVRAARAWQYARRVKRLTPSLLLVVLTSAIMLFWLVPPTTPSLPQYYRAGIVSLFGEPIHPHRPCAHLRVAAASPLRRCCRHCCRRRCEQRTWRMGEKWPMGALFVASQAAPTFISPSSLRPSSTRQLSLARRRTRRSRPSRRLPRHLLHHRRSSRRHRRLHH
jgi:hypothetical protein